MSDHIDRITLKDTMRRTQAVVIAVPLEPPHRFIDVRIAPKGKRAGEKYPPYKRILYRYRVEEVLAGALETGAEVEVDNPDWGYDLTVHKKRYIDRINKITIHERYESSFTQDEIGADHRQILLLKRGREDTWQFTVNMSVEPLRLRPRIERLLSTRDKSADDSAEPGAL